MCAELGGVSVAEQDLGAVVDESPDGGEGRRLLAVVAISSPMVADKDRAHVGMR